MTFGISAGAAMLGSAAIGAGASIYSAKQAGKGSSSTSEPWKAQEPYLKYGFTNARTGLDDALALGTYDGQRVADLNRFTTNGADFAGNYAQGYGQPAAQDLGRYGQQFLGQGSGFGSNANDIYARSTVDPTQGIIDNAGRYANNPWVDGVVDAANRDTVRQLNEQDLPSLARAASGGGNTNSTRTGVESAILQRGAADRMADTSSNIRSQFFGKGLDLAQGQWNQNLRNQIDANGGLLQTFQQGGNSIIDGQKVAGNAFDSSVGAGGIYGGYDQAVIDAARAKFGEDQNNPLDLTGKYTQLVNGNYGGTQTNAGQGYSPVGSALQGAVGGGLAGAGLYGKFNTTPVTPTASYAPGNFSSTAFSPSYGGYQPSYGYTAPKF